MVREKEVRYEEREGEMWRLTGYFHEMISSWYQASHAPGCNTLFTANSYIDTLFMIESEVF